MAARFEFVTFDCYGTLIDWESGISDAFLDTAAAGGVRLDRQEVIDTYAEIEPQVESEEFRRYRDVLDISARRVAARLGWSIPVGRSSFLSESLISWKPFADTNPALDRLSRAGLRLGILSNVDEDLLAGTLKHLDVSFELKITAQQVASYKPARAHFVAARETIGRRPWLHAAQSYFHDVVPATELQIPVAWINRNAEEPAKAARASWVLSDLAELADWLA